MYQPSRPYRLSVAGKLHGHHGGAERHVGDMAAAGGSGKRVACGVILLTAPRY